MVINSIIHCLVLVLIFKTFVSLRWGIILQYDSCISGCVFLSRPIYKISVISDLCAYLSFAWYLKELENGTLVKLLDRELKSWLERDAAYMKVLWGISILQELVVSTVLLKMNTSRAEQRWRRVRRSSNTWTTGKWSRGRNLDGFG